MSDTLSGPEDREPHHDGLLFQVELEARDCDVRVLVANALQAAAKTADELSLAHESAIHDPIPLFVVRPGGDRESVTFGQFIRNVPELQNVRRPFNDVLLRPVMELIEHARAADTENSLIPRIQRALRYLRRSRLDDDSVDRFEDLCNGLQALNRSLQKKYKTPPTSQKPCPHQECKQPLTCQACGQAIRDSDTWTGVDYLVEHVLGRPRSDAVRLHKKRNAVVHSTQPLDELQEDLSELTRVAEETLIGAVIDLIGGDPGLRSQLSNEALRVPDAPELLATVSLGIGLEDFLRRDKYPVVQLADDLQVLFSGPTSPAPKKLLGVQIVLDMSNFVGEWKPMEAFLTLHRDPRDASPPPALIVHKRRRP